MGERKGEGVRVVARRWSGERKKERARLRLLPASPWPNSGFSPSMQVVVAMSLTALIFLMPVSCVQDGRRMVSQAGLQRMGGEDGGVGGEGGGGGGGGGGRGGGDPFREKGEGNNEFLEFPLTRKESEAITPSVERMRRSYSYGFSAIPGTAEGREIRHSRSFCAIKWAWKKTKGYGSGSNDMWTHRLLFTSPSLLSLVDKAMEAQEDTERLVKSILLPEEDGRTPSRKLLQEIPLHRRGGGGAESAPYSMPANLPPGLSLPPETLQMIADDARFNSSSLNLTGLVDGSLNATAAQETILQLAQNPNVFGDTRENETLSLDGLANIDIVGQRQEMPFVRLAANQTDRPDPTNKFRTYTGGWDLGNSSYLWSVAYTGAPPFIIAALWVLLAIVYLFAVICYCCCCRRERHGGKLYEPSQYRWPLFLVVVLTFMALGGSAVLYTGAGKMHTELGDTIDDVLEEVNNTTRKIRFAADDLDAMTNFSIAGAEMKDEDRAKVKQATTDMRKAADDVDKAVEDNKDDIRKFIHLIRTIMYVVVGVTAGLVILSLVFTLLAWKPCIVLLVILGWVLIAITWLLAGIYIVVMNVTDDTCSAMKEWTQDVAANTSISRILPCVDKSTANETLYKSKSVVLLGTNLVNHGILVTNSLPPLYAPFVPLLCEPYTSDLQPVSAAECESIDSNRTTFWKYEEEWRNYTCPISADKPLNPSCEGESPGPECFWSSCPDKRLTVPTYLRLVESTWMLRKINGTTHMLVELLQCQFAVHIFTYVNSNHCQDLQDQAKLQWIGLIILSSSSMLLIFLWQLYVHRWRHRASRATSKPIYGATTSPNCS